MHQRNIIQWAMTKISTTISQRGLTCHQPHSIAGIRSISPDFMETLTWDAWYLFLNILQFALLSHSQMPLISPPGIPCVRPYRRWPHHEIVPVPGEYAI